MAEEDLDLEDDDLDLGGDDFAGELDDMMGDDELGGDSGGGGGGDDSDSELDSFFEDLSSIEDMDEGAAEPSAPAAAASTPQAAEESAPAKTKPEATKEKKKGGKMKLLLVLLLLAGAGGGAYYYWFYIRPTQMMVEEETLPVEPPPMQTIELEKPIVTQPPVQPIIEIETPPPPKPVKSVVPKRRYLVQVATCTYDVCKEDFAKSLRRAGEPVFQRSSGEKYDFIELVSSQVFTFREASQFINEINLKNKLAGKASVKSQSNGYRITMGSFPALDRAKEIKFNIEKIFPGKNVTFNLEHVRRDYSTTKIFAGPYGSRTEAKKALAELRGMEKFSGAFIVRF